MLSGLLAALAPAVPAAAREPCGPAFEQHLGCWADAIDQGAVRVTLDRNLPLDDDGAGRRKDLEQRLWNRRGRLLVEVPKGVHTGLGGTALLVLADSRGRRVADDAVIDPLTREVREELAARGACDPKAGEADRCAPFTKTMRGSRLIGLGLAAELPRRSYTVTGSRSGASANSTPAGETAAGKQGQETGNIGSTGRDPAVGTDPGGDSGWDTATQVLTVLCAVLVLLLGLLLFLIRRSARSVAVGSLSRHSLAASGVGAVPEAAAPRPRTRPRTHLSDEPAARPRTPASDEPAARPRTHVPDEATTRLRTTPSPRGHGRRVGNVPGPARPAVVRTELHPQGYVEVDDVLYRAVWAEPDRPPPAPGGLVDVTEAGERGSDVLYAFPPTPGRHAKAART
ncbi:hypothetical protein [Streptomyces populi]|uniref:hypothetical protein n=1 Tax=Streptomyces populi TaxID=2058924 RepID=UPI001F0CD5C9|nr:hypothetical protein [Streptomyces populi]